MKKQLIMLVLAMLPLCVFSQTTNYAYSKKEARKSRPTFIEIGAGINSMKFRDFATSPLFYKGNLKELSLAKVKADSKRESEIGLSYAFGTNSASVNNNTSMSDVKMGTFHYSQLYRLNTLSNDKWNVKIGGLLKNTFTFRNNPQLQNNATGTELFSTLYGSAKISLDISNKREKRLICNYKLRPRKRSLDFRMNLGIMNNTFRNGYAYSTQSDIYNKSNLFENYEFKTFSGLALNTGLDYSIQLPNKNIIKLGYAFDVRKTGGKLDKFEMASHSIKLSLLFNTK